MITHITVEDAAKLISRIAGTNELQALTYIREAADRGEIHAADALEKLQARCKDMDCQLEEFSHFLCNQTGGLLSKTNYSAETMIAYAEDYQQRVCDNYCDLRAELARVTVERDGAIKAVKNMAEYIVCAGRVDYYLCDEISQEHHLKYQPKNDGNYDNEPCYKCIADWFLQGHEWQENCW